MSILTWNPNFIEVANSNICIDIQASEESNWAVIMLGSGI